MGDYSDRLEALNAARNDDRMPRIGGRRVVVAALAPDANKPLDIPLWVLPGMQPFEAAMFFHRGEIKLLGSIYGAAYLDEVNHDDVEPPVINNRNVVAAVLEPADGADQIGAWWLGGLSTFEAAMFFHRAELAVVLTMSRSGAGQARPDSPLHLPHGLVPR